eukprot:491638-Alexandrium_andersonii.AAC.1
MALAEIAAAAGVAAPKLASAGEALPLRCRASCQLPSTPTQRTLACLGTYCCAPRAALMVLSNAR